MQDSCVECVREREGEREREKNKKKKIMMKKIDTQVSNILHKVLGIMSVLFVGGGGGGGNTVFPLLSLLGPSLACAPTALPYTFYKWQVMIYISAIHPSVDVHADCDGCQK